VELWTELQLRYSSQSLVRVIDLKMQIHSLQKGHLPMQSYQDQKRYLVNRLHLIGSPVSEADLQLFILHGMSIEYDSLVISLNSISDPVPFTELSGLLLTHEQRLQRHAVSSASLPTSSPVFPSSLASSAPVLSDMPQAHIASSSSSILGPTPLPESDLMAQFLVFLSSRGSWRGKPSAKTVSPSTSSQFTCQLFEERAYSRQVLQTVCCYI
jgi:gag-polypeptide of LTR copia-type